MTERHTLSNRQRHCLNVLNANSEPNGEMCRGFGYLSKIAGLTPSDVARSIRALEKKGLAEFYKIPGQEDGEFTGARYCISRSGRDYANSDGN